nr:TPA: gp41-like protein [Oryctes rhinoceros nudivirus]
MSTWNFNKNLVEIVKLLLRVMNATANDMFIKFANTSGRVYDYQRESLGSNYDLGSLITTDDGIIIVDRYPSQETTQLEISSMTDTLIYILKKIYQLQTRDITIFLPKMDANISKQAEIQSKFANLSVKDSPVNYFNINIIHL